MMTNELKPCPGCQKEAWAFYSKYADVTPWNACCKSCYLAHDGFMSKSEAISAWNKRVPSPAFVAMQNELRKLAGWLEMLADRSEESIKTCRFETLNDARRADAKNYRATAKHARAALTLAEKEVSE